MLLRLSPSGPPIQNASGGTADVGSGFQLRLAESQGSATPVNLTTNTWLPYLIGATQALIVQLATPSPNKRYKANFHCEMSNGLATDVQCRLRLEVSYDLITWDAIAQNLNTIDGAATASFRNVSIDLAMALGSALVVPVPPAAALIAMRVGMQAGTAAALVTTHGAETATPFVGNNWLSLAELL